MVKLLKEWSAGREAVTNRIGLGGVPEEGEREEAEVDDEVEEGHDEADDDQRHHRLLPRPTVVEHVGPAKTQEEAIK